MIVDVHAHCFPTEYLDLIERHGSRGAANARNRQAGNTKEDLEARFGMMDRAGIELQVLSCSPQAPYFEEKAHAREAATLINDLYAELVSVHPRRFKAFAALPLPHVDASLEELQRGLDQLGMVGVTILTTVLDRSLADEAFEPLVAELDRRGTTVFLHPAGASLGKQVTAFGLQWIIGAPFEDTYAAMHLILSGLTSRYPNIRFIVPHLGGTLPFLASRIDMRAGGDGPALAASPLALARRLWYDTVSWGNVPALRCACDVLGPDRIVLGTDYPFLSGEIFQQAADYIRQSGLPGEMIDAILSRNVEGLVRAR
jgi:aminocarboxymuconate-semialdehyde decarboxylase